MAEAAVPAPKIEWSFRFSWTLHEPGELEPVMPKQGVAYYVFQLEKAPDTGRLHWQGYTRFVSKKRWDTARRWIQKIPGWETCHVECSEWPEEKNRAYCTKEGRIAGPWEWGQYLPDAGKQGKRSDLEAIAAEIRGGATLSTIADSYSGDYIRYHGGIQALHALLAPLPPTERDITVIVLWGPTGTGKTHRFMHAYPEIYSVKPGRDPWGQYRGQSEILFDEYDPSKWAVQDMNRYLDKWRCMLDARYTDRYAAWVLVGICANSPPNSWYPEAAPLLEAAFRRRIRGRVWMVDNQEPTLEEIMSSPPTPL